MCTKCTTVFAYLINGKTSLAKSLAENNAKHMKPQLTQNKKA